MNESSTQSALQLPPALQQKLTHFQRRVWWIKLVEATCLGLVGLFVSYLLVFALDRAMDTPWWIRLAILIAGSLGVVVLLPAKFRKWVWGSRRLVDVARILRRRHPRIGDRLLGIVELTQDTHPLQASPQLCRAAIQQVANDTQDHDFTHSVPDPRHRSLAAAAGIALLLVLGALFVPGAGVNALQRWSMPWRPIPRFTFAQIDPLPADTVVAIGEPFAIDLQLTGNTLWSPRRATARYGWQEVVVAPIHQGRYRLQIPAQTKPGRLKIVVGDAIHRMHVEPMSRPELTALTADVDLPSYLGHPRHQKDVRGGSVTLVRGSRAVFAATASRQLATAAINGRRESAQLQGDTIHSPEVPIDEPSVQKFTWTDIKGLSAKQPFQLKVRPIDDAAPGLQCRELPREKVILEEEVLTFEVSAEDDFGVKQVGIEWRGLPKREDLSEPQQGEYVLASGDRQQKALDVQGTFAAKPLGIEAQPVELRVFAEDYLPGRERTYSAAYRIYVLTAEQHMIWLTEKLNDWQRQVLEVRDEEQRLYDRNVELRDLPADQLDNPAVRRKIGQQAAAERANARRLENLTLSGEELISQAIRNTQFNVNTLENWAKSLQGLKQLAANRMPSVANLLDQSAAAPQSSGGPPPAAPSVVDHEAGANVDPSNNPPKPQDDQSPSNPSGALGLATTVVPGSAGSSNSPACPAGQQLDQAVQEQRALLEEFNRLMDQIAQVLNDLQGSTFVKRLKFAARREKSLASTLHERLGQTFGVVRNAVQQADKDVFQRLYHHQIQTADDVSLIQEDLLAYAQRTQQDKFNQVYREMKDTRVVGGLREISRGVVNNLGGESIAEAEYWIDQIDRWADILVGPGCPAGGT